MRVLLGLRQRLKRLPILIRLLVGNAAVIIVGAVGGTLLTLYLANLQPEVDFWLIGLFITLGILLSLLVNLWILKTALRPLHALREAVDRVQTGQAHIPAIMAGDTDPDLGRLAAAINSMLERLEGRAVQLRALSERAINAQEVDDEQGAGGEGSEICPPVTHVSAPLCVSAVIPTCRDTSRTTASGCHSCWEWGGSDQLRYNQLMTRDELLKALRDSRAQIEAALAGLTEAQMTEPGALGAWSLKDILSHLTAWEAEAVTALAKVKRGLKPGKIPWTPAEVDALNAKWHTENKSRPLDRVLADFHGVRAQMLKQVGSFSDQDLNAPRPWFGGGTLAQLIRAETFEHEAEHLPHLREWRRSKLGE